MSIFVVSIVSAVSIAAAAGLWAGWLAWGRLRTGARRRSADPADAAGPYGLSLWDPHGCLNALNRCIFGSGGQAFEEQPIFLVAAHLQMLIVLSKAQGWARPSQVDQWLSALLGLHQFLHPGVGAPSWQVSLPPDLEKIHLDPLGAALVQLMNGAGPVGCVSIKLREPSADAIGRALGTDRRSLRIAVTCVRQRAAAASAGEGAAPDLGTNASARAEVECDVQFRPRMDAPAVSVA